MSKQQPPIRSVAVQRAGAARASAAERNNMANAMIDALIARVSPHQRQQHGGNETKYNRGRNLPDSLDADNDDDTSQRDAEYSETSFDALHADDDENSIVGQFAEFDRTNERLQQDIHIGGKRIEDVENANEAALAQLAELGHHLPSYQDVVNGVHSILSRLTSAEIQRQRQHTSEMNAKLISNMERESSTLRRLKREIRNSELSTLAAIDEAAVLGALQDDLLQRFADEREAIKTDARDATAKLAIEMSGTAALMSKIDVLYKQQMTLSSELLKKDALEKSIKELLERTHSLVVTKENLLLRLMNIANVNSFVGGTSSSSMQGANGGPPPTGCVDDNDGTQIAEEIQELERRYSKTVKDWHLEHKTVDDVVYKLKPRFATVQRMLREATAARDVEQEKLNRITERNEFLQSEVNRLLDEVRGEDPDGVEADPAHYPSLQTVNDLDVVVKLTQTMKKASSELAGLGRFITPIVAIADFPKAAMSPTVPDNLIKLVQEQRRIRANKMGEIKSALTKERGVGCIGRPNSAKHHHTQPAITDPSSLLLSDLHDIELAVRIFISQQQGQPSDHHRRHLLSQQGNSNQIKANDSSIFGVEGHSHESRAKDVNYDFIEDHDDVYAHIMRSGVHPSHPLARQAELDVIPPLITHDTINNTMVPLYVALGAETSGFTDDEITMDGGGSHNTTTSYSRDESRPPSPWNHQQHHRPRPPSSLGTKSRGQTPPEVGTGGNRIIYNNQPTTTSSLSNRPHSSQSAHNNGHLRLPLDQQEQVLTIDINNIQFTRMPTLSALDILNGKHLLQLCVPAYHHSASASNVKGSGARSTAASSTIEGERVGRYTPPSANMFDHHITANYNKYWLPLVPVMNERWSLAHTEWTILCVLNDLVNHDQDNNSGSNTTSESLESKWRDGGGAEVRKEDVPSWLTYTRMRKEVSTAINRNRHNTISGFDDAMKSQNPYMDSIRTTTGTSISSSPEAQKIKLEQYAAEYNAFWRQARDFDWDGSSDVAYWAQPLQPTFVAGKGPAFDVANLLPTMSAALRESCLRLASNGHSVSYGSPISAEHPNRRISTSGITTAAADLPPTSRPKSGGGGPDTTSATTAVSPKNSFAAYQLAANLFTSAVVYRGCSGICESFLAVLDGELPASSVCTAVQSVNALLSGTTAVGVPAAGASSASAPTGGSKYGGNSRANSVAAPMTVPRPTKRPHTTTNAGAQATVASSVTPTGNTSMARSAKTLLSALHKKYLSRLCLSTFHLNQMAFSLVLECGFTSSEDAHVNVRNLCGPLPLAHDWSSSGGGATSGQTGPVSTSSVNGVWCSGAHGNVTASLVNGRPDLLVRTSVQHSLIHHKQLSKGIEDFLLSPNVHSGVQCPDFLLPAHAVQVLGCVRWLPEEAPVWSANNENLEEAMAGARLTKWLPKVHPQSMYTPAGVNEFAAATSGSGGIHSNSPTRTRATMAAGQSSLRAASSANNVTEHPSNQQTEAQRKFARRYQQQYNDCGEAIFSHMGLEHVVRLANPISVILVAMNLLLSLETQQKAERAVKNAAKAQKFQELRRSSNNNNNNAFHNNKSGHKKNGDAFSDEDEDESRRQSSFVGGSNAAATTSISDKSNPLDQNKNREDKDYDGYDEEHEEESVLDESSNDSYLDSSSFDDGHLLSKIEVEGADSFSSDGEYSTSDDNTSDASSTSSTSGGADTTKSQTPKDKSHKIQEGKKGGAGTTTSVTSREGRGVTRSKSNSVATKKAGKSTTTHPITSKREDTTILSGRPPREKSSSKLAKSRRSFNRNKSFFSSGVSVGVGNEDGWEELPAIPNEVLRDIQKDCIHLRNTRELKAAARAYQRNTKLIPTWLLVEAAKVTNMTIIRPLDSPHASK